MTTFKDKSCLKTKQVNIKQQQQQHKEANSNYLTLNLRVTHSTKLFYR